MVYIASDGSIVQGNRPPPQAVQHHIKSSWTSIPLKARALIVLAAAMALRHNWSNNPLANGGIPASDRLPHQHWSYLKDDSVLVRTLADYLSHMGPPSTSEGRQAVLQHKTYEFLEHVDFGGADGHVAQVMDTGNMESLQTTRCSTTQSALTAYFCGAAVATNQDLKLGKNRKWSNRGLDSFRDFITCRHGQQTKDGHKRSVYRLGIGCNEKLAGYAHAWSIVAQPDGTFFWLQPYISQYSLARWMNRISSATGRPLGHLTLTELLAKLDRMERLMHIDKWTEQANADYDELFAVNKNQQAHKNGKVVVWNPQQRLDHFYWDEACEYPMPMMSSDANNTTATSKAKDPPKTDKKDGHHFDGEAGLDECQLQNTRAQLRLAMPLESALEDMEMKS